MLWEWKLKRSMAVFPTRSQAVRYDQIPHYYFYNMKKNYRYFLLLVLFIMPHCMMAKTATLDVMTFNARLDAEVDGINAWGNRKESVCRMLEYYSPDLIGMQEVRPNQMEDLKARMTGYAIVGAGRDDGEHEGEHCPILYSKDRFLLLKSGNFALSETPDVFGVKGWDASYNRIATWVVVKDKKTGKRIAYVNTHLDNDGKVARVEGIKLVLEKMSVLAPGLPLIVSGDFNCVEDDPLSVLRTAEMSNCNDKALISYGPEWTYHDYGRLPVNERQKIDYIFVSGEFGVDKYRVVGDKPDGHYLSDHCPVLVNLRIK